MATAEPQVAARASGFDATWLAGRRWFRSKRRRLESVSVDDAVAIDGGAWLLVLGAAYADGHREQYLAPAVANRDGALREPEDGDGAWRALVLEMLRASTVDTPAGGITFAAGDALGDLLPGGEDELRGLDEHRLQVEQTNTSVRLGDRLMLKVYRLLEGGLNPEVEVGAFLTAAGFRHTPPVAGTVTYALAGQEPAAAAMLQALVPSRGDGWQWAVNRLAAPPSGPVEALAGTAQIGGITAEMHVALASAPDAPGFPSGPAGAEERSAWHAGARAQLDAALAALDGTEGERLAAVADRIRRRLAAIESAGDAVRSRIHGDYHLGQLLRTEAGFMVVDFEGEPARSLAERRRPACPLRDVAGMLRSLDYAARTAERRARDGFAPDAWLADARAAFLSAYGGLRGDQEALLDAFEAEKACYEVRYEANNRPDWVWLPLTALERLAR